MPAPELGFWRGVREADRELARGGGAAGSRQNEENTETCESHSPLREPAGSSVAGVKLVGKEGHK